MNKIVIENDQIIDKNIENIECEYIETKELFAITKINLKVGMDSKLELFLNLKKESKLIINIELVDNVDFYLVIKTLGTKGKIKYNYKLGRNSTCRVEKINEVENIREMITASLKYNSNFHYVFKSIGINYELYDYYIYHNEANSISNIYNNSINNSGSIIYGVSSFIPRFVNGCCANQYNHIINLTDNKCEIRPNLYIDCDDVQANHSALIDKFSPDYMFYLKSRGIREEEAIKMLTKGFLLSQIESNVIIDLIKQRYGGE